MLTVHIHRPFCCPILWMKWDWCRLFNWLSCTHIFLSGVSRWYTLQCSALYAVRQGHLWQVNLDCIIPWKPPLSLSSVRTKTVFPNLVISTEITQLIPPVLCCYSTPQSSICLIRPEAIVGKAEEELVVICMMLCESSLNNKVFRGRLSFLFLFLNTCGKPHFL